MADPITDMDALLQISKLSVRYSADGKPGPSNACFDMRPGEVVLLLGPSGSGKSTLSLTVNGLIPQAISAIKTGTVLVAGQDSEATPVAKMSESVGMVFQDPDAQIVTGTLFDEVCFGSENLNLAKETVLARGEDALKQVGLWHRKTENPDRLSGGGKQRLAIACALAQQPKLLVLDEPTANLDPVGTAEVYQVLRDLVATQQHSILLIEHNLDAAIQIVDRVVVLDGNGVQRFDGPVREIFGKHWAELIELGVWLPITGLAATQLAAAGIEFAKLPLTPAELTAALDAQPALPEPILSRTADNSSGETILSAENLTIVRGKTEILHNLNFEIKQGEFLSIIGTNGAGKTTLVQALAGVVKPPKNMVRINGYDVHKTEPRKLSELIGFVFQNPEHQFIAHTVYDELAHGLRIRKVAEPEVETRVMQLLDRFGLADHKDRHPFLLSGGQKRRLSVGTALITGAPILVLDEPTFGQDRDRAAELLSILTELNKAGTTVIVVTHDMQLVVEHSHRVAVMQNGNLFALDSTTGIFSDRTVVEQVGLRLPALAEAMSNLANHPNWRKIVRLDQLPRSGGDN